MVSLGTWNRLGKRTYWLFLFRKSEIAGGFLLLALAFSIARSMSSMPRQIVPLLGLAGVVCFAIFFVALAVALISSWVVYRSHEYCVAEDALKIRQGVVTKQEIAIPYRQIQNVDIERTVGDQLLGLSEVIILTAGHDDVKTPENEAEGVLPAMDKRLASALQTELLKRADVQKVIQAR